MQDLVVRTVFILGNLTAKNNQARERFSREKASIGTLLSLFQIYQQPGLPSPGPQQPTAGLRLPPEAEDVLVKVTRVLANIAIHPRVGSALAADRHVVGLLLTTLGERSWGPLGAGGLLRGWLGSTAP